MGGRAVEGNGLENRRTCKAYRGFESHPIRQLPTSLGLTDLQNVLYIIALCSLLVIGAKTWAPLHFSLAPARLGAILCGCAAATPPLRTKPSSAGGSAGSAVWRSCHPAT